jgi:signal transduction histidine kinase
VSLPGRGFGSYFIVVVLPAGYREPIGINIPSVDVAYRFYVNGELQTKCGIVGNSEDSEVPEYKPKLVKLTPESDTLRMIFHVSNFHHRRGGIWKEISIGSYENVQKSYNSDYFFDLFSLGILISFGLFFLMFSFYHRVEKSILFLSACFLLIFLRGICTNFYAIEILMPISWKYMLRLEYLSNFAALITGVWGFFFLNPIKWVKVVLFWITLLLVPIFGAILLLPVYHFAYSIYIFYVLLALCIILIAVQVLYIFKRRNAVSILYLAGILLLILATINDILISNSVDFLFKFYILPRVFLIFIFILSIEFFRRFVETFKHERELSIELAKLNSELQILVDERTSQINEKSKIIESQNILLQKDIFLKNRILSIIGHDIRSPLSFVVMGLDLITDKNLPEKSRMRFIQKIIFSTNNLFLLVDNLLSWGMSQNKQLKLFAEDIDLSLLIDRIVDQFLPIVENKEIVLKRKIPMNLTALCDENTVTIVVRNLLSNALKFTPRQGKIDINATFTDDFIEVKVTDTGVGISLEKLQQINNGTEINSSEGIDHEKGTGLGLILCRELVVLNGGKFMVNSEVGIGSTFSFTLPKSENR